MLKLPTLREMLNTGAHFGHKTSRWHPNMEPYIFMSKSGIHIINLEKTEEKLKEAVEHVSKLSSQGKTIVFVGTKKQSSDIIKKAALACGMPYVNVRWLGGTITNFNTVKLSMKKYEKQKAELANAEHLDMPKSEISKLRKQVLRGEKFLEGLLKIEKKPDALILFGAHDEKNALKEAKTAGVELIAICDTNSNPAEIDFPIPANDDATKSIELFANVLSEAIKANKPSVQVEK